MNYSPIVYIRFSSSQEKPDPVRFSIKLKSMVEALKEENMDMSLSQTVVRICSVMINKGKRDTSKLQELVLEYTLKNKFKSKSSAIRNICKEYFDQHPLRATGK